MDGNNKEKRLYERRSEIIQDKPAVLYVAGNK